MIGKEMGMARRSRKTEVALATYLGLFLLTGNAARSDDTVETIVFVRHGEKPSKRLGQLNCEGLNRTLALPSVIAKIARAAQGCFLARSFRPEGRRRESYSYVRPLATIEPTAISTLGSILVRIVLTPLPSISTPQRIAALILNLPLLSLWSTM